MNGQPREEGQGLVEYGLIIMLISLVVIAVLVLLGAPLGAFYSNITGSV